MKPVIAALLVLAVAGGGGAAWYASRDASPPTSAAARQGTLPVTITTAGGQHVFQVERATTAAEQAQGLMFRTDLTSNSGMLFWPYPADGSGPTEASFWMKNTPTSLDILFIRADGTIARIADSTTPMSEAPVSSGEPVAAVLELVAGRAAELGIAEGDTVRWPRR